MSDQPNNQLKAVREKLGLSTEAVSRLLGVSPKTVYRWEHGEFEASAGNEAILQLIPMLAKGKVPQPCKEAQGRGLDVEFLSRHLRGCADCRLVFAYLDMVSR